MRRKVKLARRLLIDKLAVPYMANAGGERDSGLMYGAIDTVVDKLLV